MNKAFAFLFSMFWFSCFFVQTADPAVPGNRKLQGEIANEIDPYLGRR
jgi:hypothetical protein